MSTFGQIYKELLGQVKQLDVFASRKFVNRAYADTCKAHSWSFLQARGYLVAVDQITTGTVSVTQGDTAIQFDASAAALLDAVGMNVPVTKRQIKVASGLPYPISSYTAGGAAVLEQPFQGETDSAASFTVLRCYFTPPATDFLRFESVYDPVDQYNLYLQYTQQELNQIDPGRTDTSQPCMLASCDADPSGTPRYEMWPAPVTARSYAVQYQKRGVDFTSDSSDFPVQIPDELIIARAKALAYEWASANQNSSPLLKGIPWLSMQDRANVEYLMQLRVAKRQDRETFQNRRVVPQRQRYLYPISANWLQQHEPMPFFLDN